MPKVVKQIVKRPAKKKKRRGASKELASAWDLSDTMSMLLYGRSGTGKTTTWATFPKPILAIVVSGGRKPGELRSINTPEYRKAVKPYVARSSVEVGELLKQGNDFATTVLDHGSGLQDMVLKEILGLEELPEQKSWGMATQQQYGQCVAQCKEYFRMLLNLDCHRVIVAQEREFNTEAGSDFLIPFVGAALTPSLTGWLNPACDYVCETFIRQKMVEQQVTIGKKKITKQILGKGVEYCLRTAPHPVYMTKFRVPKGHHLPEVIVDPTYAKIKAVVEGEV